MDDFLVVVVKGLSTKGRGEKKHAPLLLWCVSLSRSTDGGGDEAEIESALLSLNPSRDRKGAAPSRVALRARCSGCIFFSFLV